MYSKKLAFSAFTIPAMVYFTNAGRYQQHKVQDKQAEIKRRQELLSKAPVELKIKEAKKFPWTGKDESKFEAEYSMKPVKLTGVLDFNREIKVMKNNQGEKGYDIVVPFYTHLDDNKNECGIMVNLGWLPHDFEGQPFYKRDLYQTEITGIFYKGDNDYKYAAPNALFTESIKRVDPVGFSHLCQLSNKEEASKFMLLSIEQDETTRQVHPTKPTVADLTKFRISPERHLAYSSFWSYATMLGVVGNTFMWLYL